MAKGPLNKEFFPIKLILAFDEFLAKIAIGKSFQLVCGAAIMTYFFNFFGKSPTNFQPKIWVNINFDNFCIVNIKALNLRTYF